MSPETQTPEEKLLDDCESLMNEIFARCSDNAPNFGVTADCLKTSLRKTANKFFFRNSDAIPTLEEVKEFFNSIKHDDLFIAMACANGNERAWWEFDQQYRSYLERVAHHLASTDIDAQETIDTVYVELYGTRVVDGERVSKFASYSGRGTLRGWLRTVIWHSVVDLHRASPDEVSLDEMTESVGEGLTHYKFAETELGGEAEMLDEITYARYRKATLESIETAFANLDEHEKLLLLYYHVEDLKLREIARLAEAETSPLRDWFSRKSTARAEKPNSRVYESTIMRWLEKCYSRVLELFRAELTNKYGLKEDQLEICIELATKDLASSNVYRNLMAT